MINLEKKTYVEKAAVCFFNREAQRPELYLLNNNKGRRKKKYVSDPFKVPAP